MPKLIVPVADHYPALVTYRGPAILKKIIQKFRETKHKEEDDSTLFDRACHTCFKHFFAGQLVKFSGQLIHQLLLRKIHSPKDDELQIQVGSNRVVRFRMEEFFLVTGLNCHSAPSEAERSAKCGSRVLLQRYFNDSDVVRCDTLEAMFSQCADPEDIWKLGLCLFVSGVLCGGESNAIVPTEYFSYVDDEEYFSSACLGGVGPLRGRLED